jgi:hypothetical protein
MHGHPGGLVERDQGIVAIEDARHQPGSACRQPRDGRDRRRGDTHRRDAHLITHFQAVSDVDATAIDAHFPAADHLVDATFGDPLEAGHQVVVQSLVLLILADLESPD